MKKAILYFLSSLLLFTYVVSYIGVRIHKCSCNGTTELILFFGHSSCDEHHAHIHLSHSLTHEGEMDHCHHHHRDGCCNTEVVVLTADREVRPEQNLINVDFQTLAPSHLSIAELIDVSSSSDKISLLRDEIPPLIDNSSIFARISTWRL